MILRSLFFSLLVVAASPSAVLAQDADEAPIRTVESPDEEARRVFVESREAYRVARFSEALEGFRRAYELSQRPELLYNIGQTADRLRLDRETVEAFDAYLAAIPDAENRLEVEARLSVLREEIAQEDALRAQVGASTSGERSIVEEWWFWTIIGLAVAGAAVGIGFAVGSRDELAPAIMGDIGPGGIVVALEGP